MIDYIKFWIKKELLPLIVNKLSDIKEVKFDLKRPGEIAIELYKYANFDVKIYRSQIEISGSIHTYHNLINGISEDNRGNFSLENFCQAVESLEEALGINLRHSPLIQLEVGVNIPVEFHVKNFLRQNVLMWDFDRPNADRDMRAKGHFKEFETSQFYVKIYDKGRQLSLGYDEIRLEFKYARSPYFRLLGIESLNDLMYRAKFENLARDLFLRFQNDLMIVDTVDVSFIKDVKDRVFLSNGMNHTYWEQLSTELSRFSKLNKPIHPTTVSRRKRLFLQLLEVYNLTNRKVHAMALFREKIIALSNMDVSIG